MTRFFRCAATACVLLVVAAMSSPSAAQDAAADGSASDTAALPAFPGAQGAGSHTPGGRGGTIYKVTRLDDYAEGEDPVPGTLRYALEQAGPRMVVFAVGGSVRLERPIAVTEGHLTVAGNTAPFPGITVTGYPVLVRADHVVLRYLRFRLDIDIMRERFREGMDSGWDSVGGTRCEYVVFDHLSASHSVDETISFSQEVDRVTLSNSIASYSLRSVFHDYYQRFGPDYPHTLTHNLGGLIAYLGKPDRHAAATVHHNVYAHHDRRMPGMSAGRGDANLRMSHIDIRNNVMYNWKSNAAGIETGDLQRSRYHLNFVGNYLKPGPNTPNNRRYAGLKVMGFNRVYLEANHHHDDTQAERPTKQKKLLLDRGKRRGPSRTLDQPLPTPPVRTQLPATLTQLANDRVGASIPVRDSLDHRTIRDIHEGTGNHPYVDLEKNTAPPLPELPATEHVYATSEDAFPVWWKLTQGLSATAEIDPHADRDGDGYSNIEAYMHGLPLDGEPVDWTKLENNRNPLDEPANLPALSLDTAGELPAGRANHARHETTHASPRGLIVMASSTEKHADGRGCRHVLDTSERFWSPGLQQDHEEGPAGTRTDAGPALVFAFPYPHRVAAVRIAKPHPDAYGTQHDPTGVIVEGLEGFPDHWKKLTRAELAAFAGEHTEQAVRIPADRRGLFAAYRVVFPTNPDQPPLYIQHAKPVLSD